MLLNLLLFFDVSGGEFLLIMVVAFLVFGPKKLPEIARKIGRTMNQIKSVSSELTKEFKDETSDIANELKAARESARINATNLDINNLLKEPKEQNMQNKYFSIKPPANDGVSSDNNNIEPPASLNVK